MDIWYYLVNDTRKERVESNYGQWDTFDPTLEWRRALEQIPEWSEQDSCRWVSDVGEYVSLPLPESYPFEDISAVLYKNMTDDEFREKHGEYRRIFSGEWCERNIKEFDDDDWRENVIKNYKCIPLPITTRGRRLLQPTIAERDESPKRESTSPPPLEPSQAQKQAEELFERLCSQIEDESIPLPTIATRGRRLQPTIAERDESPKRESTSPPPLEPSQVLKQLEEVLERVCSQIDEESAHADMLMLDHLYRMGKHLKIFG